MYFVIGDNDNTYLKKLGITSWGKLYLVKYLFHRSIYFFDYNMWRGETLTATNIKVPWCQKSIFSVLLKNQKKILSFIFNLRVKCKQNTKINLIVLKTSNK